MSASTTWLWTNNGRKPSRAPARPGTTTANPQRRTRHPKEPSELFFFFFTHSPELLVHHGVSVATPISSSFCTVGGILRKSKERPDQPRSFVNFDSQGFFLLPLVERRFGWSLEFCLRLQSVDIADDCTKSVMYINRKKCPFYLSRIFSMFDSEGAQILQGRILVYGDHAPFLLMTAIIRLSSTVSFSNNADTFSISYAKVSKQVPSVEIRYAY